MPRAVNGNSYGSARPRAILEDFLQKAVLLTGVYLVITSVFNQSYLRYLGLRVGLLDIGQAISSQVDIVMVLYPLILWAVLVRIPDRWYQHLAELVTETSWRRLPDVYLRFISLFVVWGVFQVGVYLDLVIFRTKPSSKFEYFVPTTSFLSSPTNFALAVVVGLICFAAYHYHLRWRDAGLTQLRNFNRIYLGAIYHIGIPFVLCYSVVILGLTVPAVYGSFKARLDIFRTWGTDVARVRIMGMNQATCLPVAISSDSLKDGVIFQDRPGKPDVHYVGSQLGREIFVVFQPLGDQERSFYEQKFSMCMIAKDQIRFILFQN